MAARSAFRPILTGQVPARRRARTSWRRFAAASRRRTRRERTKTIQRNNRRKQAGLRDSKAVGFGSPLFFAARSATLRAAEVCMSRSCGLACLSADRYRRLRRSKAATVPVRPRRTTAIRAVLQCAGGAWNHHDLEGFMAGYWKSPELTFFSGATETQGWEPTLGAIPAKYQSGGTRHGNAIVQRSADRVLWAPTRPSFAASFSW